MLTQAKAVCLPRHHLRHGKQFRRIVLQMLGSAFAALGSPVGTEDFVNVFFDEKHMSNYML